MDRFKIWDVQEDPEWQLGASLGDMEFEMDMFDDLQGDEDALRGLRQHSKEGLGRYEDWWPLREKKSIFNRLFDKEFSGALGSFEPGMGYRPGPDNDPNIIDINMLNILDRTPEIDNMRWFDVQPGSLQDKISDTYRHEYKHAGGLEHPEIYSQWEQNLDPGMQRIDYARDYIRNVETSYTAPDRGDWGPGVHLNRGGIVSLVVY